MTNPNDEEPNIVTLKNFDIEGDYERYFHCPKCSSGLISLDSDFIKTNTALSMVSKNKKTKPDWISITPEEIMMMAMKCNNCNHKDLLTNFLKKIEFVGVSPYRKSRPYRYNNNPYTSSGVNTSKSYKKTSSSRIKSLLGREWN